MTLDETIKYLEKMVEIGETYEVSKVVEEHRQLAEWLKELKQLRERTRWILCSEKMPEEKEWIGTKQFGTTISDKVFVTLENSKGERYTQYLSFQNGKLSTTDQSTVDTFFKGGTPIAWMPKPEPYKAESEEV